MRSVYSRSLALGVLVLLASVRPAHAATIDFSKSLWNPGNNSSSVTRQGVTVAATDPVGALLSWTSDGFGVDSGFLDNILGTDDEVNGVEILSITLPAATTLAGFTVSNLYYESLLGLGIAAYQEIGYYKLGGGAWQAFTAPKSNTLNTDGLLYIGITPTLVSTIAFGYKPDFDILDSVRNDFSVQSLNVVANSVATPEPASLVLFGAGLAAVAIRARKAARRQRTS
jgi:hypothetical protein